MTSIRESFVERFGEEEALIMVSAAEEHANGVNDENKGSDSFRWAICIAIGYQCFELDSYRKYHGFRAPYSEIQQWIMEDANLKEHDGDYDYLSLMTGKYNRYIPIKESAQ